MGPDSQYKAAQEGYSYSLSIGQVCAGLLMLRMCRIFLFVSQIVGAMTARGKVFGGIEQEVE